MLHIIMKQWRYYTFRLGRWRVKMGYVQHFCSAHTTEVHLPNGIPYLLILLGIFLKISKSAPNWGKHLGWHEERGSRTLLVLY